jgi:large subunit ribosomal protein L29
MTQLKAKGLREQEPEKLRQTLFDLRSELSKLRSSAERGVIRKESGKLRRVKKDIARVLTVMTEKGVTE